MKNLPNILENKKFIKVKFKVSKTQHLLIKAKINGVSGRFILDTGASNSCVGFEGIDWFLLEAKKSKTKASGAGASGMLTQISVNNRLQIGKFQISNFELVLFDLSHINEILVMYKLKPIHGIIGADVLLKGKAIIDYYNHYVYLLK